MANNFSLNDYYKKNLIKIYDIKYQNSLKKIIASEKE